MPILSALPENAQILGVNFKLENQFVGYFGETEGPPESSSSRRRNASYGARVALFPRLPSLFRIGAVLLTAVSDAEINVSSNKITAFPIPDISHSCAAPHSNTYFAGVLLYPTILRPPRFPPFPLPKHIPAKIAQTRTGTGSHSQVFRTVERASGREVAVKVIHTDTAGWLDRDTRHLAFLRAEILIHREVSGHPFVVDLLGVFEDPEACFIVEELAKGGSLLHHMHSRASLGTEGEVGCCCSLCCRCCFCCSTVVAALTSGCVVVGRMRAEH